MDARDYIKLRKDVRRRAGIIEEDEQTRAPMSNFDRHTKVALCFNFRDGNDVFIPMQIWKTNTMLLQVKQNS